jgi:hypothetical protein
MIAGVLLNLLVGIFASLSYYEEIHFIVVLFAIFAAICLAGLFISAASRSKAGPVIVIIGSIFFIPVGLVAAFGARKALDSLKQESFIGSLKP